MADIYVTEYTIGDNTYKYRDSSISIELDGKVDKIEDYSLVPDVEISKLETIEQNANHTIVDEELDNDSTNPVQNKVITAALEDLKYATDEKAGIIQTGATMETDQSGVLDIKYKAKAELIREPNEEEDIAIADIYSNYDGNPVRLYIPNTLGGNTVIANPEDPPTEVLDTIQIDDTVYEIMGGGSGGGPIEVSTLYTNAGQGAEDITLLQSYKDYNILYFTVIKSIDDTPNKIVTSLETSKLQTDDFIQILGGSAAGNWLQYSITSNTLFSLETDPSALSTYVKTVVGIKIGVGSVVTVTPLTSTGTKIATINVDGSDYDLWTPVDSALDSVSENPVQNKVIKNALDGKVNTNGTDRLMTDAEGTKLSGIEAGAQVNVQSDWNQSDSSEDDFIKNKPSIPSNINDLSDVSTTGVTSGQVLTYNGTNWEGATPSAGTITDVQVDNVSVVTSGVANIDTMTGAGVSAAGSKGLVPAPASGDNEKFLRGDGTWQTVSSGGTTVVANPSSAATENLTKLQVGNDVYGISGGGGTSDYSELTNKPQINGVTLSGNKTTRDLGIIEEITWDDYLALSTAEQNNPDKTYYIKDMGSSSGSGRIKTLLWGNETITYPATMPSDITLSANIKDFDEIMVISGWCDGSVYAIKEHTIEASVLDAIPTASERLDKQVLLGHNDDAQQWIRLSKGSADNIIHCFYDTQKVGLYQIWGIKCASGGCSIEANPSSTATEHLNKIEIEGTVYSVNENGIFSKSVIQSQNIISEFEYKNSLIPSYTQNIYMYPKSNNVVSTTSIPTTELSDNNISCTAYAIIKSLSTGGNYNLISAMYANSTNQAPNFFTNGGTIRTSVHGSDTNTNINSLVYHVLTLAIDNTEKKARFYIDGQAYSGEKTFTNSGKYITFGASISASAETIINAGPCELLYGAVVAGAESAEDIIANHTLLMTEYADYIGH